MIPISLKLRRKGIAPGSYAVEGLPEVTRRRDHPLEPLFRIVLNDGDEGCHCSVDYFHEELKEWRAAVAFYATTELVTGLNVALEDILTRSEQAGYEGTFAEGIYAWSGLTERENRSYTQQELTRFPYLATDILEFDDN